MRKYRSGQFLIKNRAQADRLARLYAGMSAHAPQIRTIFFISAIGAVCYIPGVDDDRLLNGAKRCPENLLKYGNRDAYLTMLEYIYNFGRSAPKKFALKMDAEKAMARRNPATRNKVE